MKDLVFSSGVQIESGASQVCEPSMPLASLGVETFAVRLPVSMHRP